MSKYIYRPIFAISILTTILSIVFGLYNASLSGGEGGTTGGMLLGIAILTGIIALIENFLIKNSAATKKEMLLTESIIIIIVVSIMFFLLN